MNAVKERAYTRTRGWRPLRLVIVILGTTVLTLSSSPTVSPPMTRANAAYGAQEFDILAKLNADRAANGLGPLGMASALRSAASGWSDHMAATGDWRDDPNYINFFGIGGALRAGGNVYQGPADDNVVEAALMASPPHRANILGPYNYVGIGFSIGGGRAWVTEDFVLSTVGLQVDGPPGTPVGWHGFEPLAGTLTSAPSVVTWGPGTLFVFARGSDNALWVKGYWNGWGAWQRLGGQLTSDPAAVSWAPGRIDVFVTGTDHALWHIYFASGWSLWESLGGYLTAAPAASSWGPGRIDVFVRDSSNALEHRWYDGGAWTGWEYLGGYLTSKPAAVSWGYGRVDVFARDNANALAHRWYEGGWSGWQSLGGTLAGGPGVSAGTPGRLDVFVRGADSQLYHLYYAAGWSGWEPLGGGLSQDPAATSWGPGRVDVFITGTDAQLWHKWWA